MEGRAIKPAILAGTAHPALAAAIAQALDLPLSACRIERFPDGEVAIELREPVRRKDMFIVQPTAPPVNEHLVELLALVDACRRAAAGRITAIVPYFGYARSDKRAGHREPITASMVAVLLQAVGVDQVVTVDLHAAQIEGFFHIPVDSLTAVPVLAAALHDYLPPGTAIVSPDAGRVRMASEYAHRLDAPVVVLHKQRISGTETHITHVVGDVRDRPCLIIDDMISTGGTIVEAVTALRSAGARPPIIVAATHGLLLPGAQEKLVAAGIDALYVTDSIPIAIQSWPQLHVVSIAPLLAQAIQRLIGDGSLSELWR
ncbi:MAG TPA: ribose-phosphate diphosphokinase [Herpetosiphonaceae bacterium]